jgi:uncharacterized membrane-anchored protein YitT (DUF2179 family)
MIITAKPQPIIDEIFSRLRRGVTIMDGKGAYTGQIKSILLCVVTRAEIPHLKMITKEIDPDAFLIIGQAHEVRGEGFLPIEDD